MNLQLFDKMEFRGIVISTSHSGSCPYIWETMFVSFLKDKNIQDWAAVSHQKEHSSWAKEGVRDFWESSCVQVGALVVGLQCWLVCSVCGGGQGAAVALGMVKSHKTQHHNIGETGDMHVAKRTSSLLHSVFLSPVLLNKYFLILCTMLLLLIYHST